MKLSDYITYVAIDKDHYGFPICWVEFRGCKEYILSHYGRDYYNSMRKDGV